MSERVLRFPQVDRVLREPCLVELADTVRRDIVAQLIREEFDSIRNADLENDEAALLPEAIARKVLHSVEQLFLGGVRRVINGTGVILNTNLGRAPLPPATLNRLTELGLGYTSLEIDLASGKRGERTAMVSRLLRLLTGCQSAIVVNNNASAVMLAVSALAKDKEVIVSRGELIEIGGSFRLPDVVTAAGGILKEVGTTNRTRAGDYRDAITEKTGMLLRCHRSNFQVTGFVEEADVEDLAKIADEKQIPFVEDLGSGALFDISRLGLAHEPTVDQVIGSGVGLVLFSGDKLLGGPQAGIIAGRSDLLAKLRKNPMYRALRADKLIIALIEIVLAQYMLPEPEAHLPVLNIASQSKELIKERLQAFLSRVESRLTQSGFSVCVVESQSTLGGGSLPGQTLPSYALELASRKTKASEIAQYLRKEEPPVITIIKDDKVLIDFRTILQRDEDNLMQSLHNLASNS